MCFKWIVTLAFKQAPLISRHGKQFRIREKSEESCQFLKLWDDWKWLKNAYVRVFLLDNSHACIRVVMLHVLILRGGLVAHLVGRRSVEKKFPGSIPSPSLPREFHESGLTNRMTTQYNKLCWQNKIRILKNLPLKFRSLKVFFKAVGHSNQGCWFYFSNIDYQHDVVVLWFLKHSTSVFT